MAGLQRSAVSFRRQGSSGIVWDDKLLGELSQIKPEQQEGDTKQQLEQEEQGQGQQQVEDNNNKQDKIDAIKDVKPTINIAPINTIERSRSNGERRGFRTGKVSPAIDPPSPKISACGFCSAFRKQDKNHTKKPGKRRSK
ncbi:hypothetical protein CCACVL1_27910 [Corchorus capsularis]|uniref:MAPK kinase substrate protein n=1 Tax=Corchorus capsularis TaxID=210143 RepID=A0A1R3G8F4_COCAP|nr:hypothetical protein CCACVL1_27910 [Corchorus capsularis]